eukprot:TRINITY_DN7111_c0_g1_i1.p1 TRINITY_DN7111_c0_g1~~TRINITY_DN7111_c0_g1_i1.p1  ORF type:complete len:231 (-),score=37.91 TRINITY_DN7111_c0_g1_i1:55-747(-)
MMGHTVFTENTQMRGKQFKALKHCPLCKDNPKTILAFGASLTEGLFNFGKSYHPYTIRLSEKLKTSYGLFSITNLGKAGEKTSDMIQRFDEATQNNYFDYIIILAGTNDLGERNVEKTLRNLKTMHELARSRGALSFVCTLPELAYEKKEPWLKAIREEVNSNLRTYAKEANLPIVDVARDLPHLSLAKPDRLKIWFDEIHFTPLGYDMLGDLIFSSFEDHFKKKTCEVS